MLLIFAIVLSITNHIYCDTYFYMSCFNYKVGCSLVCVQSRSSKSFSDKYSNYNQLEYQVDYLFVNVVITQEI